MFELWDKYKPLKDDLLQVKETMITSINSGEKFIDEPIIEMINAGGKLLRPALVILGSEFGKETVADIHTLAAVVELLHISTLIHDDIIDDSPMRRGIQSTQYKYGRNSAVFIGDYLFTQCFEMVSDQFTMDEVKDLSKGISKICLGEIKQNSLKIHQTLSVRSYLKMISGKTAALFSLSLVIGAKTSKAEETLVERLGKIGYLMGMAFQIQDDILDFTGDTEVLGKDLMNDYEEGYYSLPIIYALKKSSDITVDELAIEEMVDLVRISGALDQSKRVANKYIKKAEKRLDKLPDIEAKRVLEELLEKIINRGY